MNYLGKLASAVGLGVALSTLLPLAASADTVNVNFEPTTYTVGNINAQDGWSKTGSYDANVTNIGIPASFGTQSLQISNAVTSGSFGDQTFSRPLVNEAGETDALNGGMSGGTRQPHFEAQFDVKAIAPGSGDIVSISPDRGDGARMSYLRLEDNASGTDVFFDDVTASSPCMTKGCIPFNETKIATLDSSVIHTLKFVMDFVDGPSNDVVKIYIDGSLVHTGTSWENYFRFDPESNPGLAQNNSRTVDSLLFREGGTANPNNSGKGFLIDNLTLTSGPTPVTSVKVTIDKFIDGAMATSQSAGGASFPMQTTYSAQNIGSGTNVPFSIGPTGFNSPNAYEAVTADMTPGANYAVNEVTGGSVVSSTCNGTAPYALDGYSTGTTLAAATSASVSSTSPSFTGLQSDEFVIVHNKTCPPVSTLKVHILKYLNDHEATASSSNGYQFPMVSSWSASNIGSGTGSYVLGNSFGGSAHLYGADTAAMTAPANYTTHEVVDDPSSQVVSNINLCSAGKFVSTGYQTSSVSFADALTHQGTSTIPNFIGLTADEYVIVRNVSCPTTTPPSTGTGSISGTKFEDKNGNGGTNHDPKLAGVTIYLDLNNNHVLDNGEPSMVTDANGNYSFTGLAVGVYHVREVVQDGWTETLPQSGYYEVHLKDRQNVKNRNFANFHRTSISGLKFNDLNGNHKKDANEPGLQGWTIVLHGPHGQTQQVVTDANGNYSFNNLGPGTYTLSEVMKSGWQQTVHPSAVHLVSGTPSTGQNFGNQVKKNDKGHENNGNHNGEGDNHEDNGNHNGDNHDNQGNDHH